MRLSDGVTVVQVLPEKFGLFQNYPNPFNPDTKIIFAFPERSFVHPTILDLLGWEVSR